MTRADKLAKQMTTKTSKRSLPALRRENLLSSGSTLLNLAASGRTAGAFLKGGYYYFVGDSDSGKTWYTMTTLAEAANNKHFDEYDLVFNNVENGALMDIERFFGRKLSERMEEIQTEFIEDFYFDIFRRLKEGKPFVYILDSNDALQSRADAKKTLKNMSKAARGLELEGQMTDGKAKIHSQHLRRVCSELKKTGSILITISQARDNMNAMGRADKKTHSGGRAIKFYATLQIWTSPTGHISKKYKDKNRELGIFATARIKKNRITGRNRQVTVPIYHSYGIDDIGSMIDWLLFEGYTKKKKGIITLGGDLKISGNREELIAKIEKDGSERLLKQLTSEFWNEIEESIKIDRKKRYS